MTSPAASAAPASGTVIARNTRASEAPSTRAASSRSRSTPAIPARADRTKNGAETNVWARITATVVNAMSIPAACISEPPRTPRRPNTSSSARPATAGGSTIGRSTIASTSHLPRNDHRARTNASGRPNTTVRTRLTAVVARLSARAARTADEPATAASDPSRMDRTIRRQDRQRKEDGQDSGRDRDAHPIGATAGCAQSARPATRSRRRLGHDGGGRNPNSARIGLARRAGEPVEERRRGILVRRRLRRRRRRTSPGRSPRPGRRRS